MKVIVHTLHIFTIQLLTLKNVVHHFNDALRTFELQKIVPDKLICLIDKSSGIQNNLLWQRNSYR